MSKIIPLSYPDITDHEIRAATDALKSERLTLGTWTVAFEQLVANHTGNSSGVATNSGNSAMYITLESLGIGKGDEVITPAFAFPSTAASIIQLAATPRFADCTLRSLNLNVDDVASKITEKTKAIVVTHTFGNPHGIDELVKISQEHEITLIEDARQAIGSTYHNRIVGSFGRVAVFAFHSAAQLTSVEGGMIVTDDDVLTNQCRLRRNNGFDHEPTMSLDELHRARTDEMMHTLGYGCRMSEPHAAIGAIQMKRIDEILTRRALVAKWYTSELCGVGDILCPTIEDGVGMSWDGYVVRLSDRFSRENRDHVIRGLHRHDIGAADFYQSIPTLSPFKKFDTPENNCPIASAVSQRTLALPFYTTMSQREVEIVCQTLKLMLTRSTFSDD